MTDLSDRLSQDIDDARALQLGALPEAPLAMPLQVLERAGPGFFASLLRATAAPKAGH